MRSSLSVGVAPTTDRTSDADSRKNPRYAQQPQQEHPNDERAPQQSNRTVKECHICALTHAEFRPRFLDVALSEPTNEAGRRNWTLKVSVPKGQLGGEFPADSVVVFRAKTATGSYKIRIPVKGRAFDRVK